MLGGIRLLAVVVLLALARGPALAVQPLSEDELADTSAGGITLSVDGQAVGLPVDPLAPLVLTQTVGDSQVVTRVEVALVTSPDAPVDQANLIEQGRPAGGLDGRVAGLIVGEVLPRDELRLVVNHVLGVNLVSTLVNVGIRVPTDSLVPRAADGASTPPTGVGVTPGPGEPSLGPRPTTLPAGIALMESLLPAHPELAPELDALRNLATPPPAAPPPTPRLPRVTR